MKRYVFNAAHQQGMNQGTVVTALADGTNTGQMHRCSKTYLPEARINLGLVSYRQEVPDCEELL